MINRTGGGEAEKGRNLHLTTLVVHWRDSIHGRNSVILNCYILKFLAQQIQHIDLLDRVESLPSTPLSLQGTGGGETLGTRLIA